MNRWLTGLLVFCLMGATTAAGGAEIQQFLQGILGKLAPASGTAAAPARPGTARDQLVEKLRNRLPAPLQKIEQELRGVSREQEIAIGRQIAGNLLGAAPLVDDPGLQRYVNLVGRWVAEQTERADLPWHFGVLESPAVNAFAVPGGYVFITRGLYALLRDEGDLAGVLAHEIGHVLRRHHLKILRQGRLLDMGQDLLARQIASSAKIQQLIGRGAEIVARSLDRKAEFDADQIAVVLAARAGYDPFSLPAVLQQIGHFATADDRVALLFKTHPHPDARLEQLDERMGSRFDQVKGSGRPNRLHRPKPATRPR